MALGFGYDDYDLHSDGACRKPSLRLCIAAYAIVDVGGVKYSRQFFESNSSRSSRVNGSHVHWIAFRT